MALTDLDYRRKSQQTNAYIRIHFEKLFCVTYSNNIHWVTLLDPFLLVIMTGLRWAEARLHGQNENTPSKSLPRLSDSTEAEFHPRVPPLYHLCKSKSLTLPVIAGLSSISCVCVLLRSDVIYTVRSRRMIRGGRCGLRCLATCRAIPVNPRRNQRRNSSPCSESSLRVRRTH